MSRGCDDLPVSPGGTVVALHAHPDDEALLTGGTLARLAAEGCRVVLVTATDGEAGLARSSEDLAARRVAELGRAAAALGVHDVRRLGYADSGWGGADGPLPGGFATLDSALVAEEVAAIVHEVGAELLIGYDARGGYGHTDHLQVHRVARAAAAESGVRLLEATVDRDPLVRAARVLRRLPGLRGLIPADCFARAFSPGTEVTHRVDVGRYVRPKQRALRAHASQAGGGVRTVALLGWLPPPLARRVLGTEWFHQPGVETAVMFRDPASRAG